VWDVRFMPNPNYEEALRAKNGNDAPVKRYVMKTPQAREFSQRYFRLVEDSLPHYIREGKSYLTIAIGCTGGRHRSVVMANALKDFLTREGFPVSVHHRDVER
jgi:RNase adapter protein RapZ